MHELKIESEQPFSHGHSKGVYAATLKGIPVVVKRPIGDFLTVYELIFFCFWSFFLSKKISTLIFVSFFGLQRCFSASSAYPSHSLHFYLDQI